jgi:hypothetical protein
MYKNKVNAESFGVGKEKGLIKIVKLTWEFDEVLEGRALFKVGHSGPQSEIWYRDRLRHLNRVISM